MTNILVITASIFGQDGQSSQLVKRMLDQLHQAHGDVNVVTRDLASDPVPHLDAARFSAFLTSSEERDDEQKRVIAYSDSLIQEIQNADVIVLGVPMYNFGIPSALKAYFDHIARAGVTFRYTENGPVGLLEDRPVYVLAARGGIYAGTPNDSQTPYIRSFLGFIGLKDVHFVYAEGLNMGEDKKTSSLEEAGKNIETLTA
ncbi:NAD(P)H-dependent oxidoreductase [Marinobacter nanhaiticus D15-8W]|uniref:FMN dependent NADH:quinone oxidoreductase n=1 Tax=Marinobacter nanhaiticus D15-8W TaxID=626887 RepID=N6WX94_9GAMM|nr:FMN-dependent NADH-azoreductase [Marinobacter nanhaiticus]ENO15677.1 FMN-dependent NADH-azoreductase [Marinobacter nanhaiticus D15-8W]BES73471.1 NAD(P)H-dependent oxidoreductase [Marinobacter nanhaiticus D15-8W]